MVNQSKARDPRFWAKWEGSGAVGNYTDAVRRGEDLERRPLERWSREQELEYLAREALGFVPTSGLDGLGELHGHLQYGIEKGLFTQADVDAAQVQYREFSARRALGFVPTSGVDGLWKVAREGLQYGVEHGLFTRADVDAAQAIYAASRRSKTPTF